MPIETVWIVDHITYEILKTDPYFIDSTEDIQRLGNWAQENIEAAARREFYGDINAK